MSCVSCSALVVISGAVGLLYCGSSLLAEHRSAIHWVYDSALLPSPEVLDTIDVAINPSSTWMWTWKTFDS
ncbi:hypothetical protein BGX38DRAFT_1229108 [Terfezia claveryi]|nr:hypothetical protein BGX38DRAFT_1229108 [Terfezia claveryi]